MYTTDRFSDFWREGGLTIMEFWGYGEVFMIGNPKAWGDFTGGISAEESVKELLENAIIVDFYSL